ncbi:CBN-SRE-20 protein [Caenorhabditis brenneri]|uniref:CBN-SRE-20 protein n=1 Tax=Caenorhabditis brenneri TaxID=135651 RepID=G0MTW5_CAEBE|nr:CBN-SRE-20 protein [Caenorhabditis brenneri]
MSEQILDIMRNSTESNPTIFSVFLDGSLHKMSIAEDVIYSIIIFISSIVTVSCLMVVGRSNTFHTNLQGPIWWTAFCYFELTVSKMLTIVFQTTYLSENYIPIGGTPILMWIAATHYHFIFNVMCAPIVIVFERSLATKFVFDYERKKRRIILITLFIFQFSFSTTFTLLTIFNILRYVSAAVIAGLIAVSSLLMLTTLLIMLTVLIVLLAFLKTIPMISDISENTKYMFKVSTDLIVHAGPIYVTPTLFWAVEDYRRIFYKLMGYDRRKVAPRQFDQNKREEDVYFEQFLQSLK